VLRGIAALEVENFYHGSRTKAKSKKAAAREGTAGYFN
jgi:hypothetical protein